MSPVRNLPILSKAIIVLHCVDSYYNVHVNLTCWFAEVVLLYCYIEMPWADFVVIKEFLGQISISLVFLLLQHDVLAIILTF